MTLTRNFPGAKHQRRLSAENRLEKLVLKYRLLLENPAQEFGLNGMVINRTGLSIKIGIAERELIALKERNAKGGRRSTKKTGANIGRRM